MLLCNVQLVESRRRGFLRNIASRIKRGISTMGRKLLDMPPKHRSRFDKYPIYILRYHQFIWHRFFGYYLTHTDDSRPNLPHTMCWSVKCWMKRNKFKRYWKWRAPIRVEGPNSPPFLHRRCRIPHMTSGRCRREHLRHDYYWRMFMWIGRYGFPVPPQRKRFCVTGMCELKRWRYDRYWKNFWIYSSLVPILRPYDFNWRMWVWRYGGNFYRLQQITAPALQAMGFGWMIMGGMMGGGLMMGLSRFMTYETKNALLAVLQRNLGQTMALANMAQNTLRNQGSMLYSIMHMPAYSSASAAQMQMQMMMRQMNSMQYYQQMQMQQMLARQMWSMAQYLRGSCGCGMCTRGMPGMSTLGLMNGLHGPGYYAGAGGVYSSFHPTMGGMSGIDYADTVRSPMELKMRAQALYQKNNIPAYA